VIVSLSMFGLFCSVLFCSVHLVMLVVNVRGPRAVLNRSHIGLYKVCLILSVCCSRFIPSGFNDTLPTSCLQ